MAATTRDLVKAERELAITKRKLQESDDEVKELKAKVAEQTQEMASKHRRVVAAEADSGKSSKITERYHQLLKEKDQVEMRLAAESDRHKQTIKEANSTVANWQQNEEVLRGEMVSLEGQLAVEKEGKHSLTLQVEMLKQNVVAHNDTIHEKVAEISQLTRDKSDVDRELTKTLDELERSQNTVKSQQEELFTKAEELNNKIDAKSSTLKEVQKKEIQATAQVRELTSLLEVSTSTKDAAEKNFSELQACFNDIKKDHKSMGDELSHIKLALENTQRQLTLEKETSVDFRGRFEAAEERLAAQLGEIRDQGEKQKESIMEKNDLWSELQGCKVKITQLETTIQQQQEEVEQLTSTLAAKEHQLQGATRDFQSNQNTWGSSEERLNSALSTLQAALAAEKRQVQTLEAERRNQADSIQVASSNFTKFNKTIQELEGEVHTLKQELKERTRELNQVRGTLEKETCKLTNSTEQNVTTITTLEAKITEMKATVDELEEKLTVTMSEVDAKDETLTVKLEELTAVKDEKMSLIQNLSDLQVTHRHCAEQLVLKTEECAAALVVKAALQTDVDKEFAVAKEMRETLHQEQEVHKGKMKALYAELAESRRTMEVFEQVHHNLQVTSKKEISTQEGELATLQAKIDTLETSVAAKVREVEELKASNGAEDSRLVQEITKIRSQRDGFEHEIKTLEHSVSTLGKNLVKVEQAKTHALDEVDRLMQEAKDKETTLSRQVSSKTNETLAATAKHHELEKHNEKLSRELNEAKADASRANDSVLIAEATVGRVKKQLQHDKEEMEDMKEEMEKLQYALAEEKAAYIARTKRSQEWKEAHAVVLAKFEQSRQCRITEQANARKYVIQVRESKMVLGEKFDRLKKMYEELRDEASLPSSSRASKRSMAFTQVCDDAERCTSQPTPKANSIDQGGDRRGNEDEPPCKRARYEADKENLPA